MLSKAQQLRTQCLFNLQFSQTGLVVVENVKGSLFTLRVMFPTDQFVLQIPYTAELENWCVPDLSPKYAGPLRKHVWKNVLRTG